MFGEPTQTPFDLRWRMFGVPVRVHPLFWLTAVILSGVSSQDRQLIPHLLIWVACVFVSILLHELGHVFAGRLFGTWGHIVLYSFGGLAVGSSNLQRRWQRIIVYLAGPAIQLLLYALLWGGILAVSRRTLREVNPYLLYALGQLLWINWAWAILNLLPIWPLDGGRVSREVFERFLPASGVRVSLILSLVLSAVIGLNTLAAAYTPYSLADLHPLLVYLDMGAPLNALLFIGLAFLSFQGLQQLGPPRRPRWQREEAADRLPWERDPDYWKKGRDPWQD